MIETRREGAALVVTFNRPEVRNAISIATMEALIGAMDQAAADDGVSAVIFTGGPDYFSAGADLNDAQAIDGARSGVDYFNRWHRLCNAVEIMPKPAIAAIGAAANAAPAPFRGVDVGRTHLCRSDVQ